MTSELALTVQKGYHKVIKQEDQLLLR